LTYEQMYHKISVGSEKITFKWKGSFEK